MMATLGFGAIQAASGNVDVAIESARIFVAIQAMMAICTGMPHPETLKEMGPGFYMLTWLYNVMNIFAQNFQKLHALSEKQTAEPAGTAQARTQN
jgi:hypothetical protein